MKLIAHFAGVVLFASTSLGSGTASVDLVDPSDGILQPSVGTLCVDVHLDFLENTRWAASGLRGIVTAEGQSVGVSLLYSRRNDPNTPHSERIVAPGTDHRFTTFVTRPRPRDTAGRYNNTSVIVAGRYSPTGPIEVTTAIEVNAAWSAIPDAGDFLDGYVARIALDVNALIAAQGGTPGFELGVGEDAPTAIGYDGNRSILWIGNSGSSRRHGARPTRLVVR